MHNIIGISSQSHGCGKSLFASLIKNKVDNYNRDHISNHYNDKYYIHVKIIPFASTLKEMIGTILNEDIEFYSLNKEDPNPKLNGKTLRYVMQTLGSFMRDSIGNDVWIEAWKRRVENIDTDRHKNILIIVDDVRYTNEFNALKEMGAKSIFIDRQPTETDTHNSEGNITKEMCDYIVDNNKNFNEYDETNDNKSIDEVLSCVHKTLIDKIISGFKWNGLEDN